MNQETKQLTAEETLNQFIEDKFKDKDGRLPDKTLDTLKLTRKGKIYKASIEAMHAYALAVVVEDRKDAAFQLTGNLLAEGVNIPDSKVIPHIIGRKLPDLK